MHCLYANAVVQPSVQHYSCYMAWKTKDHIWCRYCHLCINAPMWREKKVVARNYWPSLVCSTDLAYVSPGIAHVGCLYPQRFEIHHVVKAQGRATIAEFRTLIKSIHRSICRPAALFPFCSVCECTIKSQCRTPCTEPKMRSIILPLAVL